MHLQDRIAFIIVTILVIIFFSCSKQSMSQEIKPDQIYDLTAIGYFPEEDEDTLFIAYPSQMVKDEEWNIYICDHMGNAILKFDRNGKIQKVIGRKGQGPGELITPYSICYGENKIFVTDIGNMRLQIFNKNGNYVNSFRFLNAPNEIIYSKEKIYAVIISRLENRKELISVFNTKGKRINDFGKYLELVPDLTHRASKARLNLFNEKIYLLFRYYPIMHVYQLNGDFEKELKFNEIYYQKFTPDNYTWTKFQGKFDNKEARVYPFRFLFNGFVVNEKGIFLGLYHDDIIVDQYDFSGKFLKRFMKRHDVEPYYMFDFLVDVQQNNCYKFYVLNYKKEGGGVPRVDILESKVVN